MFINDCPFFTCGARVNNVIKASGGKALLCGCVTCDQSQVRCVSVIAPFKTSCLSRGHNGVKFNKTCINISIWSRL